MTSLPMIKRHVFIIVLNSESKVARTKFARWVGVILRLLMLPDPVVHTLYGHAVANKYD